MSPETFLILHTLVELFTIAVACAIFMLAWNARRYLENHFLLFIGIAYFFVALLDLVHTLAYKGMAVFGTTSADPPTQLWIAARYLQAVSLLVGPLFLRRRLRVWPTVALFALVDAAVLLSVFAWPVFPSCFGEDGITRFKILSEYVICGMLLASMGLVIGRRTMLSQRVWLMIVASILMTVASEAAFTDYVSVYGEANVIGHVLKLAAFYLIYKALVETGLARPYELLFRELKAGEEALREAEQRYRTLAELSPEPLLVHVDGKLVYANRAATDLFGADRAEDLLGRSVLDFIREDDRDVVASRLRRVQEQGETVAPRETQIVRPDGTVVEVEKMGARILWAGESAVQLVIRDVTEHKRLERELLQLNELLERRVVERTSVAEERARQLKRMTFQLSKAEQRERRRLAQMLHDHLQQLLAAGRLRLGMLRRELREPLPESELKALDEILTESIQATRSLTFEIDPPILREAGLVPALEWLVEQMAAKHGLTVELTADPDGAKTEDGELTSFFFQSARELLFNVVKHAGVNRALLHVTVDDRRLYLTVEDEGRGFDVECLESVDGADGGFGILNIRERLDVMGGCLEVQSTPGAGTRFLMYAPLESDASPDQ